ncbi:hypothetical protein ACJYYY_00880 [Brochothrix campestris]|uniref:hypothetical protein n=1 Tax=Brochothrix campestris TaxID=2757 RepID=UPI0038D13A91
MSRKKTPQTYGTINNTNTLRSLRMDPKYQLEADLWEEQQIQTKQEPVQSQKIVALPTAQTQLDRILKTVPLIYRMEQLTLLGSRILAEQQQKNVSLRVQDVLSLLQLLENDGKSPRVSELVQTQRIALLAGVIQRLIK